MSSYRIIDEPNVRLTSQLIVNPSAILLAAILVPMYFKNIPLYGKFWLPFLWLAFNGYILGSASFWREIACSIIGVVSVFLTFIAYGYGIKTQLITSPNILAPYLRVWVNGLFFAALYAVTIKQSASYSIYEYVKQQAHHG